MQLPRGHNIYYERRAAEWALGKHHCNSSVCLNFIDIQRRTASQTADLTFWKGLCKVANRVWVETVNEVLTNLDTFLIFCFLNFIFKGRRQQKCSQGKTNLQNPLLITGSNSSFISLTSSSTPFASLFALLVNINCILAYGTVY